MRSAPRRESPAAARPRPRRDAAAAPVRRCSTSRTFAPDAASSREQPGELARPVGDPEVERQVATRPRSCRVAARASAGPGRCCRPESTATTGGSNRCGASMIAATAATPAGSTTSFARSRHSSRARASASSRDGVHLVDVLLRTSSKVSSPGSRPRCRRRSSPSTPAGPDARPRATAGKLAAPFACTPMTCTSGAQRLHATRDPGDQPAAADADHDGADVRALLEDLEADGSLPGDDVGMVERMDQDGPGLLGVCRCAATSASSTVDPGQPDLRAVRTGRLDLRDRCAFRHEHRRPASPSSCAASATPWAWLPALAATTPLRALRIGEPGDPHVGAAQLERAGALQVLALQVDRPADELGQRPGRLDRGTADDVARAARGRLRCRSRRIARRVQVLVAHVCSLARRPVRVSPATRARPHRRVRRPGRAPPATIRHRAAKSIRACRANAARGRAEQQVAGLREPAADRDDVELQQVRRPRPPRRRARCRPERTQRAPTVVAGSRADASSDLPSARLPGLGDQPWPSAHAHERRAARHGLEAAPSAARAGRAVRVDDDVADVAGVAGRAVDHPAVEDETAADARSRRRSPSRARGVRARAAPVLPDSHRDRVVAPAARPRPGYRVRSRARSGKSRQAGRFSGETTPAGQRIGPPQPMPTARGSSPSQTSSSSPSSVGPELVAATFSHRVGRDLAPYAGLRHRRQRGRPPAWCRRRRSRAPGRTGSSARSTRTPGSRP